MVVYVDPLGCRWGLGYIMDLFGPGYGMALLIPDLLCIACGAPLTWGLGFRV